MTFIPIHESMIDTNNTQVLESGNGSLLGSGGVFTGTATNATGYNSITVSILSDASSGTPGLVIQLSDDNSRYTTYYQDVYIAGTNFNKTYNIFKKYYKIIYTNGSTMQTYFHLITYLKGQTNDDKTEISYQDALVETMGHPKFVEPYTLLEMRPFAGGLNSLIMNSKASSGAYTGVIANAAMTISVSNGSATTGGYYKSQSRKYCTYQPGKSISIDATGILNNGTNTSGCTTRIGYYDDNDGLFFEYTNGISVNLRKGGSTTQILKSSWNGDKLDGTGPSGINLDFTKEQIFKINFSWLGAGIIRFGFLIMGKLYICHTITNYNALSIPYMSTPNLPVRYELTTASTSDYGSLLQGCATVISWGGYNPIGRPFSISTGTSAIVVGGGSEVALLAITGNSNYAHQNIVPGVTNIYCDTSGVTILYKIRLYPAGTKPTSAASPSWTDVDTNNSVVQYAVGSNILNGGSFQTTGSILLYNDYCTGKVQGDTNIIGDILNSVRQITSNVDNSACDIIVITGQSLAGNTNIYASLVWSEIY